MKTHSKRKQEIVAK